MPALYSTGLIKIYALFDMNDGRVRYVGKTVQSIEQRVRGHRNSNSAHLPVVRWAKKTKTNIGYAVLQELGPAESWQSAERYWIAFYRSIYPDLLNTGSGGEGWTAGSFSAAHREAISAGKKRGAFIPCATCAAPIWKIPSMKNKRFCSRDCLIAWEKSNPRKTRVGAPVEAIKAAAIKRKAITHCPRGHAYLGRNVAERNGRRYCRTCQKAASAAYRSRQP